MWPTLFFTNQFTGLIWQCQILQSVLIQTDWTCGGTSSFLVAHSWHPTITPANSSSYKMVFLRFCWNIFSLSVTVNCALLVTILMHFLQSVLIQTDWTSSFLADPSWQPGLTPPPAPKVSKHWTQTVKIWHTSILRTPYNKLLKYFDRLAEVLS